MLTADRGEIIPVPGIALLGYVIADAVDVAVELAAAGYDAIPHLAAARLGSPGAVDDIVARLADSPVATLSVPRNGVDARGRSGAGGRRP